MKVTLRKSFNWVKIPYFKTLSIIVSAMRRKNINSLININGKRPKSLEYMIPQIQLDFKYNFVCSNYDVPFQSLHPFIKKNYHFN